jgi:hypothetical protein
MFAGGRRADQKASRSAPRRQPKATLTRALVVPLGPRDPPQFDIAVEAQRVGVEIEAGHSRQDRGQSGRSRRRVVSFLGDGDAVEPCAAPGGVSPAPLRAGPMPRGAGVAGRSGHPRVGRAGPARPWGAVPCGKRSCALGHPGTTRAWRERRAVRQWGSCWASVDIRRPVGI